MKNDIKKYILLFILPVFLLSCTIQAIYPNTKEIIKKTKEVNNTEEYEEKATDPDILTFTAIVDSITVDGLPILLNTAADVGFERLYLSRDKMPALDFTPEFGQSVAVEIYSSSITEMDPKVVEAKINKITLIEKPDIPVQYIRGGNLEEGQKLVVIQSMEQLEQYYEDNDGSLGYTYDGRKSVKEAMDKYDDEFFKNNLLVFAVLVEGSGSFRHIVTQIDFNPSSNVINIKRITAGQGTDDMAVWHIIIEIKRDACKIDIFELNFV